MESTAKPIIGIVSPCYNEEQVLGETSKQLNDLKCHCQQQFCGFY
jgi:hypothetical protein